MKHQGAVASPSMDTTALFCLDLPETVTVAKQAYSTEAQELEHNAVEALRLLQKVLFCLSTGVETEHVLYTLVSALGMFPTTCSSATMHGIYCLLVCLKMYTNYKLWCARVVTI